MKKPGLEAGLLLLWPDLSTSSSDLLNYCERSLLGTSFDEANVSETPSSERDTRFPASGYYEWQDTPGGKQPYYFNELRARRPVKQ
jgi:hypothetical protein